MSRYSDLDSYVDPVSGVLKNRFGIMDSGVLETTEANIVASRTRELAKSPLRGRFNLKHLQAIHRYLFGDLYEWAGQLRTVDISKNNNVFAHHGYLKSSADEIFDKLARESHLSGLDPQKFCERIAYYFGEINALHPFREGNGRTLREFMSHLAQANNHYFAWKDVAVTEMLQASIESFRGDLSKLTAILRRNLHTPRK